MTNLTETFKIGLKFTLVSILSSLSLWILNFVSTIFYPMTLDFNKILTVYLILLLIIVGLTILISGFLAKKLWGWK